MRLSTAGRYGARAIDQSACVYPHRPIPEREIAEQQAISAKYLEHILKALRAGGVVKSLRGKEGGYVLERLPGSITLKQLKKPSKDPRRRWIASICPTSCSMHDVCPTRDTWVEVKEAVEKALERTTIQDLLERKRRKTVSSVPKPRLIVTDGNLKLS